MIDVNPATGEARMRGQSVKVSDYHDLFNSILGGGPAPIPARVSYDVRWDGGGAASHIRDTTFGFVGDFVAGPAHISFTAMNEHSDVLYESDAAGQFNPLSPAVGTERNGVFFS
jgi:hypothetical protein